MTATPPWRRWFIAAGVARYDSLGAEDQLPSVEDDVARMVDLFCGDLGYTQVLPELGDSPTGRELRDRLSDWFTSVERSPADVVVVYLSGHGAPGPDRRHYLLGRDFDKRNFLGRAQALEDLGLMPAGTEVRRLLVLIDVCYAGQGASEFAGVHALVDASRPADSTRGVGTYVLSASRRREVAREGAFSRLFAEAVDDPRHGGANQEYLDPRALITAVNQRLEREYPGQRAQLHALGVEDDLSPLIPNPRYVPGLPVELDLETARDLALRTHWDPRSRGVELAAESGDFFEGRVAVLHSLVAWLTAQPADDPIRVVTGGPGSGKSAVLARLVMLSDHGRGAGPETLRAPPETVPPPAAIAAAVHARNKTVEQVISELATALGREPAELLKANPGADPPCVLIDALDEAIDPATLAGELLRPLVASRAARLIVATRAHLIPRLLVQPDAVLDLDDNRWFETADVQRYVERLLTAGDGVATAAYAADPELTRDVARAVSGRAAHTFLIARLLARSLAQRNAPVSRQFAGALPASVGEAFEAWLDRFGTEKQRLKDLLRPLAYAEGAGLPWEDVWSAVASAIAGRGYGDSDIEWMREHARAFIVEAIEDGRSVYRLFHEALAEHLRPASRTETNQRRIARALIQLVEASADGPAWREAHPYIRSHLATHAAAGNVLDGLVEDAEFLVVADPSRLRRAFPAARTPAGARVRRLYQPIAHLLQQADWGERASYLELAVRRVGAGTLAEVIAQRHPDRPWSTAWAHWRPAEEHVIVARHTDGADPVLLTELDGRPVVVSGAQDGSVRMWDLAGGGPVGDPLTGHQQGVSAIAVGELNGRTIAVTSSHWSGRLCVWDLVAGVPLGEPLTADRRDRVETVAIGELHGRPIAVSGGFDNALHVHDLATGTHLGEPLAGHTGPVNAVAITRLDGRTVVVSASSDCTLRVWNLAAGTTIGEPLRGHDGLVDALAIGELEGRPIAVSGDDGGVLRLWDLEERAAIGDPLHAHPLAPDSVVANATMIHSVAVGALEGRAIAVSTSRDETLRVWDLATSTPLGEPLRGHTGDVRGVALGALHGRPIAVTAGDDGTVRAWDLAARAAVSDPSSGHAGPVHGVATGVLNGRAIAVSGGDDCTLRAWDLDLGTAVGAPLTGHEKTVRSVAVAEVDGRPIAVSAGGDFEGAVRRWDLATDPPLSHALPGTETLTMVAAVGEIGGRPVAVSGEFEGAIRVWDLVTGDSLRAWQAYERTSVHTLGVSELDGRATVVCTMSTTLDLWDLATGDRGGELRTGHDRGTVFAVALGSLDGRAIAASCGFDGTVRIHDLVARAPIGPPLVHGGRVWTVALGELYDRMIAISAGDDLTVRLWDVAARQEFLQIEVGTKVNALAWHGNTCLIGGDTGLLAIRFGAPAPA